MPGSKVDEMARSSLKESKIVRPAYRTVIIVFAAIFSSQVIFAKQNNHEIVLLKSMPQEILEKIAQKGLPDENGMVGENRKGWLHPRFQGAATFCLIFAALEKREKQALAAWQAIESVFELQTDQGNFQSGSFQGKEPTRIDDLSGVSFWLADLCHALLVVRESELAPVLEEKIAILLPKIKKTAYWLVQGENELKRYDAQSANRLFYDSDAFAFSGLLLNDQNLMERGKEFLESALKLQSKEGVFQEYEGFDSSYQAVSLVRLQLYAIYFPEERLDQAIEQGLQWELGRIKENGEVRVSGNARTGLGQEQFLGRPKETSYEQVVLALLYYGARTNNHKAIATAEQVYKFATKNK